MFSKFFTIIKIYKSYGIDKNKESLYDLQDANNLYIKPKYKREFPTMKDLYNMLKEQNANTDIELLNNMGERNCTTSTNNTEIYCFDLSNKDIKDISKEKGYILASIGEETGDLQGMLEKTADYYDDEVETATQSLLSLMEPAIMLFLAIFVVILVIYLVSLYKLQIIEGAKLYAVGVDILDILRREESFGRW